jgi:hypothetical protein
VHGSERQIGSAGKNGRNQPGDRIVAVTDRIG